MWQVIVDYGAGDVDDDQLVAEELEIWRRMILLGVRFYVKEEAQGAATM